MEFKTIG